MAFINTPRPRRSPLFFQIIVAISGGLLLFLAGLGAISGAYQLIFSGRIFPGIWMAGVDLSSQTPVQAEAALGQRLVYPKNGRIVLRDGDRVWVATPAELGMVFDSSTSVDRAYEIGRQGGLLDNLTIQLNAWQGGIFLSPVIVFDERLAHEYLAHIASQMDRPVVETDLHLDGTNVIYTPGQTGRVMNIGKTLNALEEQLRTFQDGEIALVIEERSPDFEEAAETADSLRRALSSPLTLNIANPQAGDPGPWSIEPALLAGMLRVERVEAGSKWQYEVAIDPQAFEPFLEQISPSIDRDSKNARFYFDDATHQLVLVEKSITGRHLDVPATREAIVQKVLSGEHSIPLVITEVKPAAPDDATSAMLGITGLVSSYTSYFRGSSAARLQNIQAAAARFHGLMVPPTSDFSMGEHIGDISLDNGFAEALIIYNGKTITGVGGGVCQVSTTLFRTALYGGYPILERHEHAYRVYYYEQTATGTDPGLAGLDATVYFPLVDLKFTNDRPYWLLMETYFDPEEYSLTWKFYSGDDSRSVDVQNLGLRNVKPAPDPLFEENADLPPETCKQVDWPGDGADIAVTRSVLRGGVVLFADTIRTHYEPWQAVYQYGPGTENPQALAADGLCH
jgi:vancomycin resistance protein YoaR